MKDLVFKVYRIQPLWNETRNKIYQFLLKQEQDQNEFKELLEPL